MATTITYTSDGVTRDLPVPFPYMAKSHVYVAVDGIATTSFTWTNSSTIRLNPEVGLVAGAPITVSRRTPTGTNPVTFSDGSVLGEGDLNMIATYAAYITEEAREFTDRAETAAADAAIARDLVAANTLVATQAASDAEAAATAAATFDPALYVPLTGGVDLTGHLSVPAGASGNQAPRASEVARLASTNTFTAVQTFEGQTVHGVANADFGKAPIQAKSAGSGAGAGAAVMAFHRNGAFAAFLGLDTDNALAFGGGSMGAVRRRIYHEGTLLGTCGVAGGIPTGAVIETGINANGTYTRFANGLQICHQNMAVAATGSPTWTFPAAFVSQAAIGALAAGAANLIYVTDGGTGGYVSVAAVNPTNLARVAVNVYLTAIGRWY